MLDKYIINPDQGDIILFYHSDSNKKKYAINLQPKYQHINRSTFNGVIMTSQYVDCIYPGQYLLPKKIMKKRTKVLCDQPTYIYKEAIVKIIGKINEIDLINIRNKTIASLGGNNN